MGEPLETANAVFAYITNYAQKLIMIPASLATGFSLTIIPAITKSYTSGKLEELQEQIAKIFQVLLFFTIPAAFGLASIAYDAFRIVYVNPEIARWIAIFNFICTFCYIKCDFHSFSCHITRNRLSKKNDDRFLSRYSR